MSRPSKLTQKVFDAIVGFLKAGAYVETAVAAADVHKDTFYDWLRTAAQDFEAGRDTIHVRFSDAVKSAQATSEVRDLAIIGRAATGHTAVAVCPECDEKARCTQCGKYIQITTNSQWTAAAWRLERKFPKKYGRRDFHTHAFTDDEVKRLMTELGLVVEREVTSLIPDTQRAPLIDAIRRGWLSLLRDRRVA